MAQLKSTAKDALKLILEILTAIFGTIQVHADKQPLLCGFTDDPGDKGKWYPKTMKLGKLPGSIAATANCYFSLATFLPDNEGRYRARKEHVYAVHAILLDDIGTKATKKLPIPPSWKIQTSPGNYQVGYILKTPCTDLKKYEDVVQALGKAGWTDPGAKGAARWARLPYGVNTKEKYLEDGVSPMVKLVDFQPDRRYSLKKITSAFGLDVAAPDNDAASDDCNGDDPVLSALKREGLYKREIEPGKHDITCPWVNSHTDQKDHGTVYFEPSKENHMHGALKCQHGHCSERSIADLNAFLGHSGGQPKKGSVLETALVIAEAEIQLFLDENGEPFGCVDRHCLPLKSREIRAQILRKTHEATGKALKQSTIAEVLATLESKAFVEGEKRKLHNRIALHEGFVWYDLGNGTAVKVMPGTWEIGDAPPIFRRYGHQQVQVIPKSGGDPMDLFQFLNITKAHRHETLVLLISYLIPDIAHPIFHPHGAQGSGKSTLCKLIKNLLDPSSLEVLLAPKNPQELVRSITRHHIPIFDNMSKLDSDMSDILCIACTGGSVARRMLFTDDEDYVHSFRRCCGLNGINLLISKPDLLDRTMLLHLKRILPEKRKEEAKIWLEFEEAKPNILGGMFDVLAKALTIHPLVKLDTLPRLADFATWGYAIGEALGEGKGDKFLAAYQANVKRQHEEVINNNSLCLAIKTLMKPMHHWEGTVKKALSTLREIAEPAKTDPSFPADAKNLRRHLQRIQTTLAEAEGITYRFSDRAKRDGVYITFTKGSSI